MIFKTHISGMDWILKQGLCFVLIRLKFSAPNIGFSSSFGRRLRHAHSGCGDICGECKQALMFTNSSPQYLLSCRTCMFVSVWKTGDSRWENGLRFSIRAEVKGFRVMAAIANIQFQKFLNASFAWIATYRRKIHFINIKSSQHIRTVRGQCSSVVYKKLCSTFRRFLYCAGKQRFVFILREIILLWNFWNETVLRAFNFVWDLSKVSVINSGLSI